MKEIELTQGQVALVDDWRYDELSEWKWHAYWNAGTNSYYAKRNRWYCVDGIRKRRAEYMHRRIMDTPNGMQCDHINHDTLNNQEHNLRNTTYSQNQMNRLGPQTNNSLGILGVYRRRGGKYRAQINIHGKRTSLPTRDTLEEAIADRKEAELKYYGEYGGSNV